jgi:hypothetical protein
MTACGGKVYWEMRIVAAEGIALVGLVGTSFRFDQQAPQMGSGTASWFLKIHG